MQFYFAICPNAPPLHGALLLCHLHLKINIFRTLKQLNRYYDMNQSFLLILSDFYLLPRNPEAAKTCSTDQYLGYLNRSIVVDDIIIRPNRSQSVY